MTIVTKICTLVIFSNAMVNYCVIIKFVAILERRTLHDEYHLH